MISRLHPLLSVFPASVLAALVLGASGQAFAQQTPSVEPATVEPSSAAQSQEPGELGPVRQLLRQRMAHRLAALSAENGTDVTAVAGRFQLANEYQDLPRGKLRDNLTPRVDIPLSPSTLLRVDMPFRWADPNLKSEATFAGTSDLLARAIWRFVATPEYRFIVGSDFIFPTASNDQLGGGKYQVAPGVAAALPIPEIKSVLTAIVQYFTSVGGDPSRKDIALTRLRAELTTPWAEHWWTLVRSTLNVDGKRHAKSGMTLELEMGRRLDDHWRIYGAPGVGLWGSDVQGNYEWSVEFGVRYMFYVF